MAKPSGEIIETPITANFREGLTVLQYFISTHGARKGLADTALKTANSGYLTRRLVDVAQDAIITEYDCGTMDGIALGALVEGGEIIEPMGERILGRVALDDVEDPFTHEVLVKANDEIDENKVKEIEEAGIEKVKIRSVLTCQARRGICVECYGRDLARGRKLNVKEGQKIEIGTQMAEWDPFATPIVAEVGGTIRFYDIIEGVTMNEQLDEVTGLSRKSIIESRDAEAQPRIVVEDDKGNAKP